MASLVEVTKRGNDKWSGQPRHFLGEILMEGDLHECFIEAMKRWPKGGPRDSAFKGRFIHSGPPHYETVAILET